MNVMTIKSSWLSFQATYLSRAPIRPWRSAKRSFNNIRVIKGCLLLALSAGNVTAKPILDQLFPKEQRPENHLNVSKVLEERLPLIEGWQKEINRPYFDGQGKLRWNNALIKTETTPCVPEKTEYQRLTVMLNPRVDHVRCTRNDGVYGDKGFLVGLDSLGKPTWQRELVFESGEYKIDQHVSGATQQGILLDDLTLLSPMTGEVLIPPKLKPNQHNPALRPVPLYSFARATTYMPERKGFLIYSANVTLIEKNGGIYFIDELTGNKELWLPVITTYRVAWNIREMAVAPGGRFVYITQKLDLRGSGRVSIAVFDTETRKIVYEDRFGEKECCDSPQVVVGKNGNFGFAFISRSTDESKRVLIHYRLPDK